MVEPKKPEKTAPGQDLSSSSQKSTSAAAEEAKVEAKRAAQAAAERAKGALEQQKHSMADQVAGVAHALRSGARDLPEEQQPFARYAEKGAEGLERISERIRSRDLDSLVGDAQDFARRNPLAFFAGSVAVGFFLSRFLKSSGERSEVERSSEVYPSSETMASTETTPILPETPKPSL